MSEMGYGRESVVLGSLLLHHIGNDVRLQCDHLDGKHYNCDNSLFYHQHHLVHEKFYKYNISEENFESELKNTPLLT